MSKEGSASLSMCSPRLAMGSRNADPRLRLSRWIFAMISLAATVTISFMPSGYKHLFHTHGHFHGVGHMMIFGILTLTFLRSAGSSRARISLIALAIAVGLIIETIQPLVLAGAVLEPLDMGFDCMGVALATLLHGTLRSLHGDRKAELRLFGRSDPCV